MNLLQLVLHGYAGVSPGGYRLQLGCLPKREAAVVLGPGSSSTAGRSTFCTALLVLDESMLSRGFTG